MFHKLLAQTYTTQTTDTASSGLILVLGLLYLIVGIILLVGMWKLYKKAGQPGWASIIPIYNIYVLTQIVGKPAWWTILYFVPLVNIVVAILVGIEVAKRFGYSSAFGAIVVGFLGIGYAIIGFSSAQYTPLEEDSSEPQSPENPQTPANPNYPTSSAV